MIKKYITLAALLSAGTALANAAEFKIETNFTRTIESGNAVIRSTSVLYKGGANLGTLGNPTSILPTLNGAKATQENLSEKLEGRGGVYQDSATNGTIPVKLNLTGGNYWSVDIPYTSLQTMLLPHLVGNEHLRVDSVELYLGAFMTSGSYAGQWITDSTHMDLDVSIGFNQNNALQTHPVTVQGTKNAQISGSGAAGYGSTPPSSPVNIDIDANDSAFSFFQIPDKLTLTFKEGNSDNYGVSLRKVVVHASSYTPSVTPETPVVPDPSIPEPSAFGLLAGLGALALVASRRRRK